MADVIELGLWPCCVSALDWSEDGIIALASDQQVELLFPNIDSYDSDSEFSQWRHISLLVPWFTPEELPLKEPAPLRTFSVGEEISESMPTSLSWSPAGLAKHRTCALAVLTTNLVLSIWSAAGKPHETTSWGRRLIVNDALGEYLRDNQSPESHVVADVKEKMRLWKRVRAFAWAPAMQLAQPTAIVGTQLSWGQQLIAVSNDDNHIVILAIDSPTSTLGTDEDWCTEVLEAFAVTPDSESIFADPEFFDDVIQQQRFVSHIAWSPWILRGDWFHSVIVYATNEDLRARVITYSGDTLGVTEEIVYPHFELRFAGPMKWSPKVGTDDTLTLALFTRSELICLAISAIDASIHSRTSHDLETGWDEVSGAAWHHRTGTSPHLHFSSLNSTHRSPAAAVEVTSDKLTTLASPYWQQQISESAALFSIRNSLGGHSRAKVWGLAASPMGDFIASCHTVHPSDMIEYGQPADRSTAVAINALRSYGDKSHNWVVPPGDHVGAEVILFTVKKWIENTVEKLEDIPLFAEKVLKELIQSYGPASTPGITLPAPHEPAYLDALITAFKKNAFLHPETLKDRYSILLSRICKTSANLLLPRILIAYRLAATLLDFPEPISRPGSFSDEIINSHHSFLAFVAQLNDNPLDADGEADDDAGAGAELAPKPDMDGAETCDFCNAQIPFTDPNKAACTNGHIFPRCGLSFLAIQAPGITKHCGICDTPFLTDEFVFEQEAESATSSVRSEAEMADQGGDGDESTTVHPGADQVERPQNAASTKEISSHSGFNLKRDLPVSLARVLFLACDACVYCGGKFVG